jgi:hypothetical protein
MTERPVGDTAVPPPSALQPAASSNPRRRRWRARSVVGMLLQVVLIGLGVFLGLAGEEWREGRENARSAAETLQRFRTELGTNRDAVVRVQDYHVARHAELVAYFAASDEDRSNLSVRLAGGPRPPRFESTAWDLALATGTLAYLDSELAFSLARLYAVQATANQLGIGLLDAMYRNPPKLAPEAFMGALELYYDDLTDIESGLLPVYDTLLLAVDEALGR